MKFKDEKYSDLYCQLSYSLFNENPYKSAYWLKSDFDDNVWECDFSGNNKTTIDFRIKIEKDELTGKKHIELLETIKCWLCMQTHTYMTNGIVLAPVVAMRKVFMTLNLIDYFLLNSNELMLEKHGFKAISTNDIIGLFVALGSSSEMSFSIYNWPTKLTEYLRENIYSLSPMQIDSCIQKVPSIAESIPSHDELVLDLNENELILSRIWLYLNNFYKHTHNEEYRYSIKTIALAKLIYKSTLRGHTHKLIPNELSFDPVERYAKEFDAVSVRVNDEDRLSEKKFSTYYRLLNSMSYLDEYDMATPSAALKSIDYNAIKQILTLKSIDRFRTLPNDVVFTSLRLSIEFFLNYGSDLAVSYIAIVRAAKNKNLTCLQYSYQYGISELLTLKLRQLGVEQWTIDSSCACKQMNHERPSKNDYFVLLRSNSGLWELLRILYGAILACLGTLMARRAKELSGLREGYCLDKTESYLVFHNQKSGSVGKQELIARPIPTIAAKMLRFLESIHHELIALNLLNKGHLIFCHPSQKGLSLVNHTKNNMNLDYLCDYIEIRLDDYQRRYYIRQHQLRRFFAMLFFWCNSYGGLDTLRWFLGHKDVEHVYRYITEETPGEVLRNVKAQYTIDKLCSGDAAESLSELILSHFGVTNFKVINIVELEDYIEFLLEKNNIIVEPEFFDTPEGKSYKVIVKLHGVG